LGLFWAASSVSQKMAMNTTSKSKQYAGLGLFIVAEALIFVPILYIATSYTNGDVILQAAIVTLAMFVGLTIVVFMTGTDFSFLRTALTIGGVVAAGAIVAGVLFGFNLGLWFSVGMIILISGAILYQTSNLVHRYNTDQHVAASLGLFASFMTLFFYVLRIFMSRD
jgi:FtsH-binding integral membrane protein